MFSRLAVFRKACSLLEHSREMTDILARMNETSQDKWRQSADSTTSELEELVKKIKNDDLEEEIDRAVKCYEECVKRVDSIIAELKQQLENDELAELERARKEEEEKERREFEEKAAAEKEKIMRRKMEEEREKAQKEYEKELELQKQKEAAEAEEEQKRRDKEERDRLDAIVSSRLASSDGVALVQQETSSSSSSSSSAAPKHSKYDLGNWKYADLRDAINTSNDMELLVACKEEFHRRLRIYNEWKSKNSANRDLPPTRAPLTVYSQQKPSSSMMVSRVQAAPHLNPALTQQRYFKVSFATDNNKKNGGAQSGMWYAHFNGQYIRRQLTIRPSQKPQLLVSGKDDFQMCELPLEQTGLLRKKGAEISAMDFETMWYHYGGKPIVEWTP